MKKFINWLMVAFNLIVILALVVLIATAVAVKFIFGEWPIIHMDRK